MPQTEPINPYASPRLLAATPNASEAGLRLARRVRWQVRAVSLLWIVAGSVVLGEPLTMFSGTSLMDENAGMLSLLLGAMGACVWFRWRWAIWLGTLTGLVGVTHCAFRLREVIAAYEVRLVAEVAELAIKTLVLNGAAFFSAFLAGAHVLWSIRMLGKAGIPYRLDPGLPQGNYEYDNRPADAVQVVKHARRWNRLGWSWIMLGCALAALVFPCLLLLKEESQRVTAPQWAAAAVVQVVAACVGVGLVLLGIAIRRRSGRAARIGLLISYVMLAANVANLALPFSLFPDFVGAFPDMAFGLYIGLSAVGLLMATYTHLALWSARIIERSGLPVSIRFEKLVPVQA